MIAVTFRPIATWLPQASEQRRSPFSAPWSDTLYLLDRELRHLDAARVVVQLAITEQEIRLDGWPRGNARPRGPDVILAFESRHGHLKYATNVFASWQDNLRAIALGLESLRRVDRYGITKRGEQYAGWRALPSGEEMSRDEAEQLLERYGGATAALKATHPDHGGDADAFRQVQRARELVV